MDSRDRPSLVVVAGKNLGSFFAVSERECTIGRAGNCNISLDAVGMSRLHAVIRTRSDNTYAIEDLGSTHGTYVNGHALEPSREHPLNEGDKIMLGGHTVVRFSLHDHLDDAYQNRAHEMALRDPITMLFNKNFMMDRLTEELSFMRRHKIPVSLIVLDIDALKKVNIALDYEGGDKVLQQLAALLVLATRREDVLCRIDGGTFAVVCRSEKRDGAVVLAERLRALVERWTFRVGGQTIHLSVSLGVSTLSLELSGPQDFLATSTAALREAKQLGRNRVSIAPA